MSSSNNTAFATAVAKAKWELSIFSVCWTAILIALGIVGNTFNIIIFTRRSLRPSPCTRYFLVSAIAAHGTVYGIYPIRLVQFGFNIDIFAKSIIVCKILSYVLVCLRCSKCLLVIYQKY